MCHCYFCVNDTKRKCPLEWYAQAIQVLSIQFSDSNSVMFAENERSFYWVMNEFPKKNSVAVLFEFMNSIGNVNHVLYATNGFGHCFQMKSILVSKKEQKNAATNELKSSAAEQSNASIFPFIKEKKTKHHHREVKHLAAAEKNHRRYEY